MLGHHDRHVGVLQPLGDAFELLIDTGEIAVEVPLAMLQHVTGDLERALALLHIPLQQHIGAPAEPLVKRGQLVRKGQLLARIDPREYEIALEESRYRHLQALSQMAAEADTFEVNHEAVQDFTAARAEMEEFLGRRVHLFCQVKVRPNWLDEAERYTEMGLDFRDGGR